MRGLIIICLCTTVLAAPQGYNYNHQQNGFQAGLPNFSTNSQIGSSSNNQNNHENHGFLEQAANAGNLEQALLHGQTISKSHNTQQLSSAINGQASASHNIQQFSSAPNDQASASQNTQQFSPAPNFNNIQAPIQQNFGLNNIQQHQQTSATANLGQQLQRQQQQSFTGFPQPAQSYPTSGTITKDIYVHVDPDDSRDQQYQQPAPPVLPPRKHYRIVFIKAPSPSINHTALRIRQAPTEERTIIYVLTKKADPLDLQAAIRDFQPKQPSKPEVYFIKYKTKEEAQHAQRTIQAQYEQLGGTSQVSDEGTAPVASVIGSLDGPQPQPALDFTRGSGRSRNSLARSLSKNGFTSNGTASVSVSKYLPPIKKS